MKLNNQFHSSFALLPGKEAPLHSGIIFVE